MDEEDEHADLYESESVSDSASGVERKLEMLEFATHEFCYHVLWDIAVFCSHNTVVRDGKAELVEKTILGGMTMRVLQINAVYKTKSTGRIAMEMHRYFKQHGIESYVAYATENTDDSHDPCIFRIGNSVDHKIHAIAYRLDHLQGMHSTFATKSLLKRIELISPDIVITHNLHSNYINVPVFLKGLKQQRINVVMCLHDCWFMTGGCYHYTSTQCEKWLSGCSDCPLFGTAASKKYQINCDMFDFVHPTVVATSKWIAAEAKKSLISSRADIRMIYDWIDTETFYPRNGDRIREKLGIGSKIMILGVATGWSPDKGQNEMIAIAKAKPEAAIVLVGSQAEKVEYPSNVILVPFTDSKEELAEIYSAADVFFNPSKQETFGLVSGEALACGTPIVVYNTTACPEFVTDGTGAVADNEKDILCAVDRVLEHAGSVGRKAVADQCRAFVMENFLMERNLMEYIKLFNEVISSV